MLILSFLALIQIFSPGHGGWLGIILASLQIPFGATAAAIINVFILLIAIIITANIPIKLNLRRDGDMPHEKVDTENDVKKPTIVTKEEPVIDAKAKPVSAKENELEVIEPKELASNAKNAKLKPQVF